MELGLGGVSWHPYLADLARAVLVASMCWYVASVDENHPSVAVAACAAVAVAAAFVSADAAVATAAAPLFGVPAATCPAVAAGR